MSNFNQEIIRQLTESDKRLEKLESRQSPIKGGTDATISGGVITASRPYHRLLPQTGTTDDLDTITPPYDSKFLLLHTKTAIHTITVKDGTGNLNINGDCSLSDPSHTLYLMYDEVINKWVEVSRSQAGGGKQYATFVVAADDSTDADKANADYVCDGTADEVQVNAAMSAVTPSTYRRVLLLEGTYNLAATVTMVANSVLEGQGDATVLRPSANAITTITTASNSTITNLKLDSLATTGTSGINVIGKTDVKVDNLTVVGFPSKGVNITTSSSKIHIYKCRFYDNAKNTYAVYADTSSLIQVMDCYFDDCDEGVWLDGSDKSIVADCVFNGGNYGIDAGGTHNVFVGNRCDLQTSVGIYIYSGNSNIVADNECFSCESGIYLDTITRSVVNGNICKGDGSTNGIDGITIDGSSYNVVSDNTCSDNSNQGILVTVSSTHNRIADNYLIGNSWVAVSNINSGMEIQSNSDYNFISGNMVRKSSPGSSNYQQYGIWVSNANCNDNIILDNDVRDGGQTTGLLNSGTNSQIINADGSTPQRTLTLATDIVTVSGNGYYTILPESGTADDMITINGFSDGMIVYLRAETAGHIITVKETGNIDLVGGQFVMVGRSDFLVLLYDADQAKWMEIARSHGTYGASITIASDTITAQKPYHTLLPETGTSDSLSTINGGWDGYKLTLRSASTGNTITLVDGTGNLELNGNYVMEQTSHVIELIYNSVLSKWVEQIRSQGTSSSTVTSFSGPISTISVEPPLYDDDEGNGFTDSENGVTGWNNDGTHTPEVYGMNYIPGYWMISCRDVTRLWSFWKQPAYDIETMSSGDVHSVIFGPIMPSDDLCTVDINYYFSVHADIVGPGYDADIFARWNLYWDSAASTMKLRPERKDGTTQTDGSWITLSRTPLKPIYLTIMLKNDTNKNVKWYISDRYFHRSPSDYMSLIQNADIGSGVTWGQIASRIHHDRTSGSSEWDYLWIGSVDHYGTLAI